MNAHGSRVDLEAPGLAGTLLRNPARYLATLQLLPHGGLAGTQPCNLGRYLATLDATLQPCHTRAWQARNLATLQLCYTIGLAGMLPCSLARYVATLCATKQAHHCYLAICFFIFFFPWLYASRVFFCCRGGLIAVLVLSIYRLDMHYYSVLLPRFSSEVCLCVLCAEVCLCVLCVCACVFAYCVPRCVCACSVPERFLGNSVAPDELCV